MAETPNQSELTQEQIALQRTLSILSSDERLSENLRKELVALVPQVATDTPEIFAPKLQTVIKKYPEDAEKLKPLVEEAAKQLAEQQNQGLSAPAASTQPAPAPVTEDQKQLNEAVSGLKDGLLSAEEKALVNKPVKTLNANEIDTLLQNLESIELVGSPAETTLMTRKNKLFTRADEIGTTAGNNYMDEALEKATTEVLEPAKNAVKDVVQNPEAFEEALRAIEEHQPSEEFVENAKNKAQELHTQLDTLNDTVREQEEALKKQYEGLRRTLQENREAQFRLEQDKQQEKERLKTVPGADLKAADAKFDAEIVKLQTEAAKQTQGYIDTKQTLAENYAKQAELKRDVSKFEAAGNYLTEEKKAELASEKQKAIEELKQERTKIEDKYLEEKHWKPIKGGRGEHSVQKEELQRKLELQEIELEEKLQAAKERVSDLNVQKSDIKRGRRFQRQLTKLDAQRERGEHETNDRQQEFQQEYNLSRRTGQFVDLPRKRYYPSDEAMRARYESESTYREGMRSAMRELGDAKKEVNELTRRLNETKRNLVAVEEFTGDTLIIKDGYISNQVNENGETILQGVVPIETGMVGKASLERTYAKNMIQRFEDRPEDLPGTLTMEQLQEIATMSDEDFARKSQRKESALASLQQSTREATEILRETPAAGDDKYIYAEKSNSGLQPVSPASPLSLSLAYANIQETWDNDPFIKQSNKLLEEIGKMKDEAAAAQQEKEAALRAGAQSAPKDHTPDNEPMKKPQSVPDANVLTEAFNVGASLREGGVEEGNLTRNHNADLASKDPAKGKNGRSRDFSNAV